MKRKTVAVFVANLYNDMVREMIRGIEDRAREADVKLLLFTCFGDDFSSQKYPRYTQFDAGDFAALLLPDMAAFDGLISFDTYMPVAYQKPLERLKAQVPCPVVTVDAEKPGSYTVVTDQNVAMRDVIEHVVVDHGCRDLVHIAGKPGMGFTYERIDIFKDVLSRHGLPCDDSRIVFGNLQENCAERVLDEIFARRVAAGLKPCPEALICANDYMAIGVIWALEARGYRVPTDVIVTGYDDIRRAEYNDPAITTAAQPFFEIGRVSMDTLTQVWRGEEPPRLRAEPGILIRRQSCGCVPLGVYRKDDIRDKYIRTVAKLEDLSQSNTALVLGTSSAETFEDVLSEIEQGCLRDTGFSDAVLCLAENWDGQISVGNRADIEDTRFDVVCGIHGGKPVKRERLPKGALLPRALLEDDRPYFIFPVHNLEYFMGYFIATPDMEQYGQIHVKSWLLSIGTMLENWRIRRRLADTVSQLDHLYQTDMLTGLYNRRGFYRWFEAYYGACRDRGTGLAVFLIDMNRMKAVNDTYGHAEGDWCLCAIAGAMRRCATKGEVCVRTGGDEFVVLAKDYDHAAAEAYVAAVRGDIARACREEGKPYSVTVSIGWHISTPPAEGSDSVQHEAELFLHRADEAMYQEKRGRI